MSTLRTFLPQHSAASSLSAPAGLSPARRSRLLVAALLLGGSTHDGEEVLLAQIYQRLRSRFPKLFLILVPRHFERAKQISQDLSACGLKFISRSSLKPEQAFAPGEVECLLVDSTGELLCFYEQATVVFVGKSITAKGGQNPIEPAALGKATVFGHLRRALEFNLERTGKHGLPCGLLADWNDCLKLGYQGESVFVTFQLRLGLKTYAEIAAQLSRPKEAKWALAELAKLDRRIAKTCWDGKWFIWAISEEGVVFGTKKAKEGQIYLNTQCWAILSGAATAAQTDLALAAVKSRLASEYGVALCNPPFAKTPVKVMRAVLFNPGNKENGGIFSHTQSWAVLAEIARGNGDQAYAYYRSFMPAAQNDQADLREIEPYVHCQSTHAIASKKYGRSRVPWLSGTASWSHFTATNHILGIRPELDGLRIDPCIPKSWPGFSVSRVFRGQRVSIEVTNPLGVNRGVRKLTVDGRPLDGSLVPVSKLKQNSKIVVELG